MKSKYLLIYAVMAISAAASGCSTNNAAVTPLFADTDLISVSAATRTGTINYSLPSGDCTSVVIGLFDALPQVDGNNQLKSPPAYGTRTEFTGFVPSAQPWTDLYAYNAALAGGQGDFDPSSKIILAAETGTKYLVIWAYDDSYRLIASSQVIETN